jgi:nucleoid-associated protein YgaU
MSARLLHILCTALLVIGPHLLLQGCSGSQQEDGDLQGEEQQAEEGNEEASVEEVNNQEGNIAEEGENVAAENQENMAEENNAVPEEETAETESQVLDGEQTKSDLEDIIAGQNADSAPMAEAAPVADTGEVPAESAPVAAMPPAVAAGPALPEQGSKMPYIVRVGETLSSIATTIYGNTEKWTEMAELSSIKNSNMVRPGDVVYYQLAPETLAFATAYEGATRTEVTIQAGDTLAAIAERVYGNSGDWKYVWRQNANIENPDRLEVGMTVSYLSPASLGAALDYARSLTLADLIQSFDQKSPKTDNQSTNSQLESATTTTQTGFDLATDMFHNFTTNFATAG